MKFKNHVQVICKNCGRIVRQYVCVSCVKTTEFINNCDVCERNKMEAQIISGAPIIPVTPYERWEDDHEPFGLNTPLGLIRESISSISLTFDKVVPEAFEAGVKSRQTGEQELVNRISQFKDDQDEALIFIDRLISSCSNIEKLDVYHDVLDFKIKIKNRDNKW